MANHFLCSIKFFRSQFIPISISALALVLASCGGGGSGGGGTGGGGTGGGGTNVPPKFTGATSFTFAENQTVQFQLTITDPDSSTITVTDDNSGDGALFSVDNNGLVMANAPGTFDFENPQDTDGNNVYEQNITLSDGTSSTTTTIRVTITDVNEAPVCEVVSAINFEENFTGDIYDFNDAANDPEGTAATGFALTSVGRETNITEETENKFSLDRTTGKLSLTSPLDAEKVGIDGKFFVDVIISYGAESVPCQQTFQLVDVPGAVSSGIKLQGTQTNVKAIGDLDNDGLADFWLRAPATDSNGDSITDSPPAGYVVFGKKIKQELDIDGAEILELVSLSADNALQILANFPEDTSITNESNSFSAEPIGDVDGDGTDDLIMVVVPTHGSGTSSNFANNRPFGYLLWGDKVSSQADGEMDLAAMATSEGIAIFGENDLNRANMNATSGDFDGDGIDDLVFGAPNAEKASSTQEPENGQVLCDFWYHITRRESRRHIKP